MVRAASRNVVAWLLLALVLGATLERHPASERLSLSTASAHAAQFKLRPPRADARGEHGFCVACFLAAAAAGAPGAAPRAALAFAAEPLGTPTLLPLLASADLGASSPRGPPRT
jgi:hypothetical protein